MPSMNVSLTDELISFVHGKVATGMYNNGSEVVREALRRLDMHEQIARDLQLVQLKEALKMGIQQAENQEYVEYSYDSLIKELRSAELSG